MSAQRNRLRRAMIHYSALLLLPLTGGCTTWTLDDATNRWQTFGGVVEAFAHDGELGVAYIAVGNRRQTRVAWFNSQALREGTHPSTGDGCALPLRIERSGSSIPKRAQPLPVALIKPDEDPASALRGAPIRVFYRPNDERGVARPRALARMESGEGALIERELHLPLSGYRAWHYYAVLPFAVALDIVTLPVSVLFCPYIDDE